MAAKCSRDRESRYEDQDEDSSHAVREDSATKGLNINLFKGITEVNTRLGRKGGWEGERERERERENLRYHD